MENQKLSNISISNDLLSSYQDALKRYDSPHVECIELVLILLSTTNMPLSLLANKEKRSLKNFIENTQKKAHNNSCRLSKNKK
jgi:hypothetical protein